MNCYFYIEPNQDLVVQKEAGIPKKSIKVEEFPGLSKILPSVLIVIIIHFIGLVLCDKSTSEIFFSLIRSVILMICKITFLTFYQKLFFKVKGGAQ